MPSYISSWPSGTDSADLLGSAEAPVTLSDAYEEESTSSSVDMLGSKFLVFFVYFLELGGSTRLDLQLEVSESSDSNFWLPLQTEQVSSGIATQDTYEIQKSVSEEGLVYAASIPVRGFRYWRIKLKVDSGSSTAFVRFIKSGGPI